LAGLETQAKARQSVWTNWSLAQKQKQNPNKILSSNSKTKIASDRMDFSSPALAGVFSCKYLQFEKFLSPKL